MAKHLNSKAVSPAWKDFNVGDSTYLHPIQRWAYEYGGVQRNSPYDPWGRNFEGNRPQAIRRLEAEAAEDIATNHNGTLYNDAITAQPTPGKPGMYRATINGAYTHNAPMSRTPTPMLGGLGAPPSANPTSTAAKQLNSVKPQPPRPRNIRRLDDGAIAPETAEFFRNPTSTTTKQTPPVGKPRNPNRGGPKRLGGGPKQLGNGAIAPEAADFF